MLSSFYTILGLSALALARPSQYIIDGHDVAPWKTGSNSIHIHVDATDNWDDNGRRGRHDRPIDAMKMGYEDMDLELRALVSRASEVEPLVQELHLYNHMVVMPHLNRKLRDTAEEIMESARRINGSSVVKNEDKVDDLVASFMDIASTAGHVGQTMFPKLGYMRLMKDQAQEIAKGMEMYKESIKALGKAFAPSVPDATENIKHGYIYVRDLYKRICDVLDGEQENVWA